jgi:prepilin peptidase CpaA
MILVCGILMDAFFIALLICCAYTDIKGRTILNRIIVILLCLGIGHMLFDFYWNKAWLQYPGGLLLVVPFYIAWLKNGMGAGDVKLIAAIALYLGLCSTMISFVLVIPILAVILLCSYRTHKTIKVRIPFAPVLGICAAVTVILGYFFN